MAVTTEEMQAPSISLETARAELPGVLRRSAAHLRVRGDLNFLSDEPEIFTTFQLVELIEQLADKLASGDVSVIGRIWAIFAPTCAWDDALGDSLLGQAAFELADRIYRPA